MRRSQLPEAPMEFCQITHTYSSEYCLFKCVDGFYLTYVCPFDPACQIVASIEYQSSIEVACRIDTRWLVKTPQLEPT